MAKLLCGLIEFSGVGVCERIRAADTGGHGVTECFHTPPLTGNRSPPLNINNISLTSVNSVHNNIPPIKP